ncbi:MAG: hypothetical protein KUG61_00820 [Parvibaculaceae bacterium]|nr:hypothetical protein [Parvibaculaceae bacterium]
MPQLPMSSKRLPTFRIALICTLGALGLSACSMDASTLPAAPLPTPIVVAPPNPSEVYLALASQGHFVPIPRPASMGTEFLGAPHLTSAAQAAPKTPKKTDTLVASLSSSDIPLSTRTARPLPQELKPGQTVDLSALDNKMGEYAAYYQNFSLALTKAVSSQMKTPRQIKKLLLGLRFSEAGKLSRGWMAHRALVAAQDSGFKHGVRQEVGKIGAKAFLNRLRSDSSYALNVKGAQKAEKNVIQAISADNIVMAALAKRFMSASRTFQRNKWGALSPAEMPQQADNAVDLAALEDDQLRAFFDTLTQELSPISSAQASYTHPLVKSILALGAQHIVNEMANGTELTAVLPPAESTRCLRWARLNLNQCLAAAHFPSEVAWCTSRHALNDVRVCWIDALPHNLRGEEPKG